MIRRRAIPHAIRHRAIPHMTTIPDAVSGTGSFRTRQTLRHTIRHQLLLHAIDFTAHDPAPDNTARDDPFVSDDVWLPEICPDDARKCPIMFGCQSVRQPHYGMRAAQRSASGAPLAGMEIGTDDGTGRIRKTPRFTGRASGVTCTRLLGGLERVKYKEVFFAIFLTAMLTR